MTESEIYAVNLHMARLTGWPVYPLSVGFRTGAPQIREEKDNMLRYINQFFSDKRWNPWEDREQCFIVMDRLIETGRIHYYELSSFQKGEWGCQISTEPDKYNPHEDGDTPAQAMCRAFVKLEVAT